jgi:predicted ATPase
MPNGPLTAFISYRREDSAGFAGRLADTLRRELDEGDEVLRDVDEMIEPGEDFRTAIVEAVERADAVIAIIGPRWLSASDLDGSRRLDEERDVVRLELIGAMDRGVPLIPVLVDGAEMPAPGDLPPELASLAARNAIELTDTRWEADCEKLIESLRAYAGAPPEDPTAGLPRAATPLLGRERELAQIESLLADDARLVTLTGPGGIGKTRVSLEAAWRLAERFDRVIFSDLATIDDPELVLSSIARAASVEHSGEGRLVEVVGRALGGETTLLVLDNFEHVLDAGPQISELLGLAPTMQALVTSRAALRISGEREQPIAPLGEDAAVALFVERARAVKPDLDPSPAAGAAIASICARLDGLPLAIELAAARIRLLSPEAMLGHLGERLALLTHGAHDLPERQQTVRATIEWSYRLLDEGDRELLSSMSVFAGGASLDAIQAVCAPGASPIDVLDRLQTLSENSLVFTLPDETGSERYRMLELIREFSGAMLAEAGNEAEVGRRHAQYFEAFVERHGPELDGGELMRAFATFDADYPNLIEALGWTRVHDEPELELALLGWLGEYWYMRGYYLEPWSWLAHALGHTGASPARRARVMRVAGSIRIRMGDIEGARELFQGSLEICDELGDRSGEARSLSGLEGCYALTEQFDLADEAGERALEIVRELGENHRVAFAAANAGYTALMRGDLPRARAMLEEAESVSRGLQNPEAISNALQNLGLLHYLEGDLEGAWRTTAAGLLGAVELREHLGIVCGLVVVAAVRAHRGEAAAAAQLLGLIDAELEVRDYVLDPVESRVRADTLEEVSKNLAAADLKAAMEGGAKDQLIETARAVSQQALEPNRTND